MPVGVCQAKSQRSSAASLDDTDPQQVTSSLPLSLGCGMGGRFGYTPTSPGARGDGRFRPRSEGCGFALPERGQAVPEQSLGTRRGLRGGPGAHLPAAWPPPPAPPVHLVCVFLRSTLPAGYVRGEECRATLCHEIRLTFLG